MSTKVGVLEFLQPIKRFGFISSILPSGEVVRFYLSPRNIVFVAPLAVLGVGCGVIFDVAPPKRPGDLPFATNVRIYEDELHALVASVQESQEVEVETVPLVEASYV
jgi:hypothetical protein